MHVCPKETVKCVVRDQKCVVVIESVNSDSLNTHDGKRSTRKRDKTHTVDFIQWREPIVRWYDLEIGNDSRVIRVISETPIVEKTLFPEVRLDDQVGLRGS